MSLLNDASLVLIPSGYKEDKVYSIIPSDGSGDLDFVRGSEGTRINSLGQVERTPWNLIEHSQTFTISWLTSSCTITNNNTIAPNGTNTGNKASCPSGSSISPNAYYSGTLNCVANETYTYSYYAKKGTTNFAKIRFSGTAFSTVTNSPFFNLDAGTVVSGTGTIESVGNGWYRISATAVADTTGSGVVTVDIPNASGSWPASSYSGTEYIYIWGAQLNVGSTAKPYFPTTDRLNVPRLTYENGCPSLLLEKQSTNVVTYSEDFTNAAWTKGFSNSILGNSIISPDGTQNADKIQSSATGSAFRFATQLISPTTVTYSIYAKAGELSEMLMFFSGANGIYWNLTNGSFISYYSAGASTISSYSSQSVGNGWYRYTMTSNTPVSSIEIYMSVNSVLNSSIPVGNGFYIWGAQAEASAYPTSYIPTTSTSVTRLADSCSKTSISSLIGQTEGTIYAEIKVTKLLGAASRYVFHLSDGTANNRIYIAFSGADSNVLRARIFSGGTLQCSINSSALTSTGTYKLAMAYKNNDIVFYINGIQIGTDTSATIPMCSKVDLGHNQGGAAQFNDGINNANIWKTRLTNTELEQLTTI
jgi:hypothetical protein